MVCAGDYEATDGVRPIARFLFALETHPKTRSLLSVFEEDAGTLTNYTNQLLQSMQRVFGAQNEMALATEQLSKQLLDYEKQNFALAKGDEEVINTLQHFAKSVEEVRRHLQCVCVCVCERERALLNEIHFFCLSVSSEHEAAMVKYSRLPKKRENEKIKAEVVREVAYCRRKQHQAAMQYYCALNALQYRKRVAMLEPMLGYTHAQINFFKKGMELVSKKMDSFLSSVSSMNQSIESQLEVEAEVMRSSQRELLSVDDTVYMPDHDQVPVNRALIQKAGYLNIRNKTGLVTTAWDRLFFFTQGGNLMCQPRGAVAGGMVLDLDNSSVMAVECEDRRYCFQITSPNGKTYGDCVCVCWICTLNNISRQIYLTDNPEAVAIRLHQTALQAVTPITSFEKRAEAKPGAVTSREPQKPPTTLEPEDLIVPGTPIQFDIVLPASEFLDQNRAGARSEVKNQLNTWRVYDYNSLLQQVFAVRFLGSMAVRAGHTQDVIYEAMRQVLAARAIHNIFKTTESHLMVTSSCIRLIDPQTQVTKISFQLKDVTQFAAHQENSRLMGFVLQGSDWSDGGEDQPSFSVFVFESNTEGEKICYTINLGKEISEAKKDPEALVQLMKSMPLTNDGKFLLLESETGDEAEAAGPDEQESEA
uniref:Adaptor protein, phosphotyrosine interaction, PH domain and leucine zipper containing 2 n=1 Tax=Cyprinus carpio TaxID=7962 RepID=A0A8C2JFN3_CYPCA